MRYKAPCPATLPSCLLLCSLLCTSSQQTRHGTVHLKKILPIDTARFGGILWDSEAASSAALLTEAHFWKTGPWKADGAITNSTLPTVVANSCFALFTVRA